MITWRFYFWYFRDRYCSLYSPQLCWGLNGRSVMVADKEFQNYSEGIFKPYFEKFIEFKRSKGEKVGHSALVRMKALNDKLNSSGTLHVTKETAEEILAPKDGVSRNTRYARISFLR